ncbi:MAG: hypothetical protein HQL53_02880 [Magnetococcales bacterium]|nr:hypothetical protein [Magnetococcales bacterium]
MSTHGQNRQFSVSSVVSIGWTFALFASLFAAGSLQAAAVDPSLSELMDEAIFSSSSAPSESESSTLKPSTIREKRLVQSSSAKARFFMTPRQVELLALGGMPEWALQMAEQVLAQGEGGASVSAWLPVKAAALLRLGRYGEARTLLEARASWKSAGDPRYALMFADALLEEGHLSDARKRYGDYLAKYPQAEGRFKAQVLMALCSLQLGALDDASFQLDLYEQEAERPEMDPLLLMVRADLDRAQKREKSFKRRMDELEELERKGELPRDMSVRQTARSRLALWHADEGHWSRALALAEAWLREESAPPARLLHANLIRRWVATTHVKSTTKSKRRKKRSKNRKRGGSALGEQDLWEALYHPSAALSKKMSALKRLLAAEDRQRLGLLRGDGALAPAAIGWAQAMPEEVRLYFAKSFARFGRADQAQELLRGLEGARYDGVRLRLMGLEAQPELDDLEAILRRLPPVKDPLSWYPQVRESALWLLFRLTDRGFDRHLVPLRRWLVLFVDLPSVDRGLRLQQALVRQKAGEPVMALMSVLPLVAGPGGETKLLSAGATTPNGLMAHWARQMGFGPEARIFLARGGLAALAAPSEPPTPTKKSKSRQRRRK